MSSFDIVANQSEELADLYAQKLVLLRKLARVYRIKEIWPEAFHNDSAVETFTTSLGGTGTVRHTMKYFIERLEDGERREITKKQWDYISGVKQ